jgi:5-methylcytosine-specific restriction endonuclease McrA
MSKLRHRRNRRRLRVEALARQGGRCAYCGKSVSPEKVTGDHIVPKASGGNYVPGNIVAACRKCNTRKADVNYIAFRMTLRVPRYEATP